MNKRNIIGLGLILIVLIGSVFVFMNRDEFFRNEVKIAYPDGCVENYVNAVLIGDKCESSNIVSKQYGDGALPNFTFVE